MKGKFTTSCLLIVLLLASCHQNNSKQQHTQEPQTLSKAPLHLQEISEVITRFAEAYLHQDTELSNQLINPETGLAIIHRPGAMDVFTLSQGIDYQHPIPEHFPYGTFQNQSQLSFQALPVFDCGEMSWDKTGFFCDTTANSNQQILNNIAIFEQQYQQRELSEELKEKIQALEEDSYRVILNASEDDFLIFHVKKFDTGWYVTILDRAYAGCDA